jgi:hypothetical protein
MSSLSSNQATLLRICDIHVYQVEGAPDCTALMKEDSLW